MRGNDERYWIALVTFERRTAEQNILPQWAHGACGWMAALAQDEEEARSLLVRDTENVGLRVLEIDKVREVFGAEDIEEVDEHLTANFRNIAPGKETVWGAIHCYMGEGEA